MKKKVFTAIGLMSGTSMDGIDMSLIKSDGYNEFVSIFDTYYEFEHELREKLLNLRSKILKQQDLIKYFKEVESLDKEITIFHKKVIKNTFDNINEKIDLIGFHGQTIFHDSDRKVSKQLGDGKLLSKLTKKIVVSNFRQNDLDNGGQGAPLTPIFHKSLLRAISQKKNIHSMLYFCPNYFFLAS